ncbi:MAG: T9SS type A sorting domain-containing protein, partial [Saprospiraceae bacterium]
NPARDLIQIRFDDDLSADGIVEILTTTGTVMKSLIISEGSTSAIVDMHEWPAGVYFVRYRDNEGRSSVERVVVE